MAAACSCRARTSSTGPPGTTAFVKNYLHVNWDGSETQNDKATSTINGVPSNPVAAGLTSVTLNHAVLKASYEDQITPILPGAAAFTDATGKPDALTVASGNYKVFFAAFPVEAFGTAAQKATLFGNTFSWFAQ